MAAVLLAVVLLGQSAGGPVPYARYQSALHRARVALDSGRNTPGLRASLRRLASVRLPDGSVVHTDLPGIASRLAQGDSTSTGSTRRAIDTLDDVVRHTATWPADPAQLRVLDQVLRDRRFHPPRPPWAFITDWLSAMYRRVITWLDDRATNNSVSSGIFALLLVALVAGVGFLVSRRALGRMVREVAPAEESDVPATPVAARERAAESARTGDYQSALRFLFLATMLDLQASGAIELRPGVTNREYLRLIRPGSMSRQSQYVLEELVYLFDAVRYGHRAVSADEYARAGELSRRATAPTTEAAA
jgi:hypothetical protein